MICPECCGKNRSLSFGCPPSCSFLTITPSQRSKINDICLEAHRYMQQGEYMQPARFVARALDIYPQSIQLQFNYAVILFMSGYLDYAWKVSCYTASQFSLMEKNPWQEKLYDNMDNYFYAISLSDRGEKEMDLNGKSHPLIRHPGLPPEDCHVTFPFSKEKISLCMIAKNEEDCIERALSSVEEYVDEIILVDTGSTDRTCSIASSHGAKIYQHPWNNDFSESRNQSLNHATGEWILILDADETINYLDMIYLRELASRKDRAAYSLRQRHYTNQRNTAGLIENDEWYNESIGYAGWLENIICRFFRRDPRVYYKRPVHEAVEYRLMELDINPVILDIPVHHYGKLSPPDIRNRKSQLYIDINRRYLESTSGRKEHVWGNFQIGQSLSAMGKPEEAVVYLEKAVDLMNQGEPMKSNDSIGGPVVALSTVYLMLNRPRDAMGLLKRQIAIEPENDYYWLALARVHIRLEDYSSMYRSLDRCLALNPENATAQKLKEKIINSLI
jgi:tetratricopeptide (TPR) repeat protein